MFIIGCTVAAALLPVALMNRQSQLENMTHVYLKPLKYSNRNWGNDYVTDHYNFFNFVEIGPT